MLNPVLAQAAANGKDLTGRFSMSGRGRGRQACTMDVGAKLALLASYPPSSCVKIGDTISDIEAAKCRHVDDRIDTNGKHDRTRRCQLPDKLPITQKEALLKQAASEMLEAADFVAEDLSACDHLLRAIHTRLEDRRYDSFSLPRVGLVTISGGRVESVGRDPQKDQKSAFGVISNCIECGLSYLISMSCVMADEKGVSSVLKLYEALIETGLAFAHAQRAAKYHAAQR